MAESARLMGRNGALWREYCRGATMEALAEKYNLTAPSVHAAIHQVRDSIPQQERAELIKGEVDFFRTLRTELMELWDGKPTPVTVGKDGDILRDPDTDEIVRDHGGRIHAIRVAVDVSTRMHKLLGLEASQKVEIQTGEAEAAQRAAAEAATFVHGGTDAP